MSEAYKKFTAQDYAVVPFNTHKQYLFNSQSADDNQLKWYNVSWTSESISLYSSASSQYGADTKNTVKYNQLDHLFYKNFKNDTFNRFGYNNYLIHKRELYNKALILSIPAGLYGHEVKPGSFIISSSNYQIADDSHGNLIISGTIVENYPSDIRKNIFKLGPVKGFKAYDLDTIPGYAVKLYDPQNKEEGITKRFWRRGVENPNVTPYYTTPKETQSEIDDSYYFNPFKYNNVTFSKNTLGSNNANYSSINFNSENSSHIAAPHDNQYNFNEEDFSISFYIKPEPLGYGVLPTSSSIGTSFGGGIIYHVDNDFAYIISTTPIGSYFPLGRQSWEWGPLSVPFNGGIGVGNVQTGPLATPAIGDGEQQTKNIKISDFSNTQYLGGAINNFNHNGYSDWYIPTLTEIHTADTNLNIFKGGKATALFSDVNISLNQDGGQTKLLTSTENIGDFDKYEVYTHGSITGIPTQKNSALIGNGVITTTLPVRRIKLGKPGEWDNSPRYIICKSGTQTIIPDNTNTGTETPKNTTSLGTLQSRNVISQPQFPFEIYMISHSLHFDRSDGDILSSVNCLLTGSSNYPEMHHVLCQKSASKQEIYIDGNLKISSLDTTVKQTQNLANLYIGSKGHQTSPDGGGKSSNIKFFNGSLSNINIWNESFNSTIISNVSESINASPYIGNIFYQNGFVVLTDPDLQDIEVPSKQNTPFNIATSQFQQRLFLHDYNLIKNVTDLNSAENITPKSMKFDDVGTKLYITYIQNSPANKAGNSILQLNIPSTDPYDLYKAGLDVDTTGNGAYLIGTKQDNNPISSSYANISSSFKNAFNNAVAIDFKYDGTSIFTVGDGYTNYSGSEGPGAADNNASGWTSDPAYRYAGGIAEIPLATAWDISSGSGGNGTHTFVNPAGSTITLPGSMNFEEAKVEDLSYVHYHSHIDGYIAQQNMSAAQLLLQHSIISTTSSPYIIERGHYPNSVTWKKDGTRFWTTHFTAFEKHFQAPNNWRYNFTGPFTDPFNAQTGGSIQLEEWYVSTPWDMSTIQRTGKYVKGGTIIPFCSDAALIGTVGTTIDSSVTNSVGRVKHYGKVGKSLDLSTIVSPEGYPIVVRDIHFNGSGTKMWLLSDINSLSEPLGTRFAAGGHGPDAGTDPNAPGWIPFTNNGTKDQGAKMWEFDLTVPFDILTNVFVQTFSYNERGGIIERASQVNDILYATTGQAGVDFQNTATFQYTNGVDINGNNDRISTVRAAVWHPDGESYFLAVGFANAILKLDIEHGISLDNPGAEKPYKVHFQGSHLIYENEYQCTIDEYEFNSTLNISARKIKSQDSHELANFTTSSLFKPYITTVGLYNEDNELLVVGKLGQPVKASDETDTTIILRWDS